MVQSKESVQNDSYGPYSCDKGLRRVYAGRINIEEVRSQMYAKVAPESQFSSRYCKVATLAERDEYLSTWKIVAER